MISVREFEHFPRKYTHYAIKLVGRGDGHDATVKND